MVLRIAILICSLSTPAIPGSDRVTLTADHLTPRSAHARDRDAAPVNEPNMPLGGWQDELFGPSDLIPALDGEEDPTEDDMAALSLMRRPESADPAIPPRFDSNRAPRHDCLWGRLVPLRC